MKPLCDTRLSPFENGTTNKRRRGQSRCRFAQPRYILSLWTDENLPCVGAVGRWWRSKHQYACVTLVFWRLSHSSCCRSCCFTCSFFYGPDSSTGSDVSTFRPHDNNASAETVHYTLIVRHLGLIQVGLFLLGLGYSACMHLISGNAFLSLFKPSVFLHFS